MYAITVTHNSDIAECIAPDAMLIHIWANAMRDYNYVVLSIKKAQRI
jgi:hypothetical protein